MPHIVAAIEEPSKTAACMRKLRDANFRHALGSASLALLMPIIRRAFDDRNVDTRIAACAVIAAVCQLCNERDILPYVADIRPGIQRALLDPTPEVRAVGARALGEMARHASAATRADMQNTWTPWLRENLVNVESSVNRAGAAQGMCELNNAMEDREERLNQLMASAVHHVTDTKYAPHLRDGYLMLLVFMPQIFNDSFMQHLPRAIPLLLKVYTFLIEVISQTPHYSRWPMSQSQSVRRHCALVVVSSTRTVKLRSRCYCQS